MSATQERPAPRVIVWYHDGTEDPPQYWESFREREDAERYIKRQYPREGESFFIRDAAATIPQERPVSQLVNRLSNLATHSASSAKKGANPSEQRT
jgi:hypothetical protein